MYPLENNIYFVSGIDTGIGKTYVTGFLARRWNKLGCRTITQKLIQTGNTGVSEDIELHRQLMGSDMMEEDNERLTMPEIYSYPCSPHLAAEIDKRPLDLKKIHLATLALSQRYDAVLLEGAGGLMVPLSRDFLTIDYISQHHYPVILVTSGRLGSINHTLLSLEAIASRNIHLHTLAYNLYEDRDGDDIIRNDTKQYIKDFVSHHFPNAQFLEIPVITTP